MPEFFKAALQANVPTILVVGSIGFFLLAFIRRFGTAQVGSQPNFWAIGIGAILLIIGIASSSSVPHSNTQNFPFEATVYEFEEPANATNGSEWFSVPESKSFQLTTSQNFSRSGRSSLRLVADIQSAATNPETEYAGIGLKEGIPSHTKAIVAWILIPESEPVQDVVFKAHILSYVKTDTGTINVFMGEDTRVTPGTWIPLFLGTFGETDSAADPVVWNGKIDELYLSIWSDQPYRGSIYIDDISIYQ